MQAARRRREESGGDPRASERKAPAHEACKLFNAFSAAEAKMMKYAADNAVWCGIPPQVVEQHARRRTPRRSKFAPRSAKPPPRRRAPAGPSLSDALVAPVTDANNIKTGRGTFDTLTGTPLGNR